MNELKFLRAAISEYSSIVGSVDVNGTTNARSEHLESEIRCRHDWTDGGARTVVRLANDYGAFMLRNALAVAIALGKEDGDLGF